MMTLANKNSGADFTFVLLFNFSSTVCTQANRPTGVSKCTSESNSRSQVSKALSCSNLLSTIHDYNNTVQKWQKTFVRGYLFLIQDAADIRCHEFSGVIEICSRDHSISNRPIAKWCSFAHPAMQQSKKTLGQQWFLCQRNIVLLLSGITAKRSQVPMFGTCLVLKYTSKLTPKNYSNKFCLPILTADWCVLIILLHFNSI